MLGSRPKFIALFVGLYLVLEIIIRVSILLASPPAPPINVAQEWIQYLLLPVLIAFVFIFFPVEEERFPVRSVLITIAVYWVYMSVLVIAIAPSDFRPVMHALVKYTIAMGVIAGLAAFGARKILAAIESGRSASK